MNEPNGHRGGRDPAEPAVGELVSRASEQLTGPVRAEPRLAREEMKEKGRRFGVGGGLSGGAGALALSGVQVLVPAATAAPAPVLPRWAPPAPREALDGTKADMAEIRERAHR